MPATKKQKKEFADHLFKRFEEVKNKEWYEALIYAALDETQGDLGKAIALADEHYSDDDHSV